MERAIVLRCTKITGSRLRFTVPGNLVGGLKFTGLTLYATHLKTAPKRSMD